MAGDNEYSRIEAILSQLQTADSNRDQHFSREELALALAKTWAAEHPEDRNLAELQRHIGYALRVKNEQGQGLSAEQYADGKKYVAWFDQQSDRLIAVLGDVLRQNEAAMVIGNGERGNVNAALQTQLVTALKQLREVPLTADDRQAVALLFKRNFCRNDPAFHPAVEMNDADFPAALRDQNFSNDADFLAALTDGQVNDPIAIQKFRLRQDVREIWQGLAENYQRTLGEHPNVTPDSNDPLSQIRNVISKYTAPTEASTLEDFSQAIKRVAKPHTR